MIRRFEVISRLAAYGFRPFFLLTALYAAGLAPIWATGLAHGLFTESGDAAAWHGHEMLFGVTGAAMAGFLLTAVPSWTATPPLIGRRLLALVGIWLLGRLGMILSLAGILPSWLAALIDLPFLPLVTLAVAPALLRGGQGRHGVFALLLAGLFIAQALSHLGSLGLTTINGRHLATALFTVAILAAFKRISMVVIPLALEETADTRRHRPHPVRADLAAWLIALWAAGEVWAPGHPVVGWLALAAGAAALDHLGELHVGRILRRPYVAVFYAALSWIALGLIGIGVADLGGPLDESTARHAMMAGGIGSAMLAVLSIAGLRHTGRQLMLPRRASAAFVLVSVGTTLRVAVPILTPEALDWAGHGLAALLWSGGFALWLSAYGPYLLAPRADGQEG